MLGNTQTEPIYTPEMRQFTEKVFASDDLSLMTAWHGFLKELSSGMAEIVLELEAKIGELLAE